MPGLGDPTGTRLAAGRFVWIGDDETIQRLGVVEFARLVNMRREDAEPDPAEALGRVLYRWRWPDDPGMKEYGQCGTYPQRAREMLEEALGWTVMEDES